VNVGRFNNISEEEGSSTLINGAEGDRICCEKITQSRHATAEAASPCDGWCHMGAASNKELLLSRVESELQTQTHVPTSEQDFSDPRSLLKTDLSALIDQIVNVNSEQNRELYEILERHIRSFMSKPGICKLFGYKFRVEADRPILGSIGKFPHC
jgi:hypothetical protein